MDARVFNLSKLPSRHVTEGPARAPHRAILPAPGLIVRPTARSRAEVALDRDTRAVFGSNSALRVSQPVGAALGCPAIHPVGAGETSIHADI